MSWFIFTDSNSKHLWFVTILRNSTTFFYLHVSTESSVIFSLSYQAENAKCYFTITAQIRVGSLANFYRQ